MTKYEKVLKTVVECPNEIEAELTGKIPKWLLGTLLRNGPGIYEYGQYSYKHLFDPSALIQSFRIENGKVFYKSKYLNSKTYQANKRAQRIVVGEFGTAAIPDPCQNIFSKYFSYFFNYERSDNDVIDFLKFGDKICTATEGTQINEIDVSTLDVKQHIDFGKYISVNTATAHPHYDEYGNMYNIGNGPNATKLIFTPNPETSRGDADDSFVATMEVKASIPSRKRGSIPYHHSFGMSKDHVVFMDTPLSVNLYKMMKHRFSFNYTIQNALHWDENGKVLFHVIKRKDWTPIPLTYTADPLFIFHHANTYEEDGCLVVDVCGLKNAEFFNSVSLENLRKGDFAKNKNNFAKFCRFVLPLDVPKDAKIREDLLKRKKIKTTCTAVLCEDGSIFCTKQSIAPGKTMDFPRINYNKFNGIKYRFCYLAGNMAEMFNELYKLDVETGEMKIWKCDNQSEFVGEPVFIANPNGYEEDDGVVLSTVTNAEDNNNQSNPDSYLLILDGQSFEEISRAKANHFIPFAFHGQFIS